MAEVIFQRRKIPTVTSDLNPLIILLILSLLQSCCSQVINQPPHFIPQIGDMSQFILPEDTPVGTPVYHLKGDDELKLIKQYFCKVQRTKECPN